MGPVSKLFLLKFSWSILAGYHINSKNVIQILIYTVNTNGFTLNFDYEKTIICNIDEILSFQVSKLSEDCFIFGFISDGYYKVILFSV